METLTQLDFLTRDFHSYQKYTTICQAIEIGRIYKDFQGFERALLDFNGIVRRVDTFFGMVDKPAYGRARRPKTKEGGPRSSSDVSRCS